MTLILASASPRRKQLLALLGIKFRVAPSGIKEDHTCARGPVDLCRRLATAKALAAAKSGTDATILAADTVVVLGRRILGKPSTDEEAMEMLSALRGRRHKVVTAVALYQGGRLRVAHEVSWVVMRRYSRREMLSYVRSGRFRDKAGAYGIQDRDFYPAASVKGCISNVMGLSAVLAGRMLLEAGFLLYPDCRRLRAVCPHCAKAFLILKNADSPRYFRIAKAAKWRPVQA